MFKGFSPEAIDFLWGIRFNNRKDWFEANKEIYLKKLFAPMKELAGEVFAPLENVPGLCLHISRIYRDARYAHGLPYKDSLWFSIRLDSDYWAEHPCLYFDLHPDYYGYGLALVAPRAAAMQAFRDRIAGRPDAFAALVNRVEKKTGLKLDGDRYRRPKPCTDPRVAPYFELKNLFCLIQKPIGPELFDESLPKTVAGVYQELMPLFEEFQNFAG